MKKIAFVISFIFIIFNSNAQFVENDKSFGDNQSFEKGNIVLDVGIGIGVLDMKQTNEHIFTNADTSISTKEKEFSVAINPSISIRLEYGFSNKIGFGASFTYTNYNIFRPLSFNVIGPSSSNSSITEIKAIDLGLNVSYHFLKSTKHDLFVRAEFGFDFPTRIKISRTQLSDFNGSGKSWRFDLVYRIYSSKRVSEFVRLGYEGSFINISDTDESTRSTFETKSDFIFNGVVIQAGLAVKF